MDLYENLLLASLVSWGIAGGVVTACALGLLSPLALLLPSLGMMAVLGWMWMTWEPWFFESAVVVPEPGTTELVVAVQRQTVELLLVLGGWILSVPLVPIGVSLIMGCSVLTPLPLTLFVAHMTVLMGVIMLSLRQDRLYLGSRILIAHQRRVLVPGMAGMPMRTPLSGILRDGRTLSLSDVVGVDVVADGLRIETIDGACDLPIPGASQSLLSSLAAALYEHAEPLGAFDPQAAEDRAAMQAALAKVRPVASA